MKGPLMRPDGNAQNILSTTRATAKMHEFRVAPEDFIARLPEVWSQDDATAMGLVVPGARGGATPVAEVPPEAQRS